MRHADCSAYHYALPIRTAPCRYSWFQLSLMSTKPSTLLSYTASKIPIAASTTVLEAHNNKQDILMPSQMFKADDSMQITESHIPYINNLIDSNVVDIHLIQSLPTSVKLLSYIWSYQWKRSPQGALLKHKAWNCANEIEQEFRRDYWDTYAPMVLWSMICLTHTVFISNPGRWIINKYFARRAKGSCAYQNSSRLVCKWQRSLRTTS